MKNDQRLFLACIIALVTTSFGFIVRALLLTEWGQTFNLTDTQLGALQGAGLFPFALSIILFSLIVDRLGYHTTMALAWGGHVVSAVVTMTAQGYTQLYVGTLLFALANGAVEAVINPVTTTLYPRSKTHHLNILHAGWPGGLVLGGVLALALGDLEWRWKIGLFLLPAMIYGAMLVKCTFPVQERVAAGVSYRDMLREFGWGGCLVVSYFVAGALDEVARGIFHVPLGTVTLAALTLGPTLLFGLFIRSLGRPVFIILLLVMILLATTELGTDSWVTALMTPVLAPLSAQAGAWLLIYTSAIMFVLRFTAGPLSHRLSPLGLLAACSLLAAAGLWWLSHAGSVAWAIFLAATLYGVGKTFFWPTMLGVVSEQFPKGGALTINAMGGMGMIAVGVLGNPLLGVVQDRYFDEALAARHPEIHQMVAGPSERKYGMDFRPLDKQKMAALPEAQRLEVDVVRNENNQRTLARMALLPVVMAVVYLGLILYYRTRGGYKVVELSGVKAQTR